MADNVTIDIRALVTGLQDVRNLVREIERLPVATKAANSTSGASSQFSSLKSDLNNLRQDLTKVQENARQTFTARNFSSAQVVTEIKKVRAEVNQNTQAFVQQTRAASAIGRTIRAAFSGNVTATLRGLGTAVNSTFRALPEQVSNVGQAVNTATQFVDKFSNVLGTAAKNTQGALNATLINDFGISAERALVNPSIAAQKFISVLAQIPDAEERAIAVSNVFGASTAKLLPIIEAEIAAQEQQLTIQTAITGAEERLVAAQAQLATATAAATSAITGDVAATQALMAAETEVTAATLALAEAQGTVVASSEAMAVSETVALGIVGGLIGVAALLTYGLIKLATAETDVVSISKTSIENTQKRITLLQQELEVILKVAAANGDEAAKRQLVIEAKKKQLEISGLSQQLEEKQIILDLTQAILNQQKAEVQLHNARFNAQRGYGGQGVEEYTEALKKAEGVTKDAAEAVDNYSAATGKNKEQLFAHALALFKETDAVGDTHNAFEALVISLKLTIDANGNLVPSTDAVTAAIERQTTALENQNSVLRARNNLQQTQIRTTLEQIADQGLTGKAAASELQRRRGDSLFTDSPYAGLDAAIKKQQQVKQTMQGLQDIIDPPDKKKGGGGIAGRIDALSKGMADLIKAGVVAATAVWRDQLKRQQEILAEQLDANTIDYENYYKGIEALQKADIDVQLQGLHEQLDAQTDQLNKALKPGNRLKIQADIQKTLSEISILEAQRGDVSRKASIDSDKAAREYLRTISEIKAQLDEFAGGTADAAATRIDEQFREALEKAKQRTAVTGDDTDVKNIENLKQQLKQLARFEELENRIKLIESSRALKIAEINTAIAQGTITQADGNKAIKEYEATLRNLIADILPGLEKLANTLGKPELQQAVTTIKNELGKWTVEGTARDVSALKDQLNLAGRELANTEKQIDIMLKDGSISAAEGYRERKKAQEEYIKQTALLLDQLEAIAKATHDADLQADVDEARTGLADLATDRDELAATINNQFLSSFQTLFTDIITGTKSAGEAFKAFGASILAMLAQVIVKLLITKLLLSAFGGGTGQGGVGGWLSGVLGGDEGQGDFAAGGLFRGRGTGTSDSNTISVSDGEYIVNAAATARNLALLEAINSSINPARGYATGGLYSAEPARPPVMHNNFYTFKFNRPEDKNFRLPERAVLRDAARQLRGAHT